MSANWFTNDKRLKLSTQEVSILQALVNSGDRAAFYMAYYAMTGETEALVTAKISTFSEGVGGGAMASNWFLQDAYRSGPPPAAGGITNNTEYEGIWWLSQEVAKSALVAINDDLGGLNRRSWPF